MIVPTHQQPQPPTTENLRTRTPVPARASLAEPLPLAAEAFGQLAYQALIHEVRLTPKPGLVDLRNTGSHRDMTLATFEASAAALRPCFEEFVAAGMASANDPAPAVLPDLRRIGLTCEQAMYAATGGINTHKGAIFSFGLLLGAAGRCLSRGEAPQPDRLCREVSQVTVGLVERELAGSQRTATTAGEYIYRRYGLTGARGEAQSGFASVRQVSLPAYRAVLHQGGSPDLALLVALVHLLATNGDTNIVARGGLDGLAFARREAACLKTAGSLAPDFVARLEAMDDALIARNLSPGGTADLVGITWFLAQLDH